MGCDCISMLEEKLQETHPGARVSTVLTLSGTPQTYIPIPLEYAEKKRGQKKLPLIVANYCPLCGQDTLLKDER